MPTTTTAVAEPVKISLELIKNDAAFLSIISEPVLPGDDIKSITDKLYDIVTHQRAPAISAIQIGVPKQLFIMRMPHPRDQRYYDMGYEIIKNPKIVDYGTKRVFIAEGCLSFPGVMINTERYEKIAMIDDDHPNGRVFTGILAQVVSHETDHLLGKLFFDREYKTKDIGRNDLCECGSGKKYKKCCGK